MKNDLPDSALYEVAAASVKSSSRTPDILIYQIIDKLFAICEPADNIETDNNVSEEDALSMLRPLIDVHYICQSVLGDHWDNINSQQQQEFALAFCDLLLHTYARKLIHIMQQHNIREENIETCSINQPPTSPFAMIEIRLSRPDGRAVDLPIQFHFVLGEWKVSDVMLDEQSLIGKYRNMFSPFLQNSSIGELTASLIQQREQLQVA